MMSEDINVEYEKIVPPKVRKCLFDDSEDYESLRSYIMSQPYNPLHKKHLPFKDVELLDYICYKWILEVDSETEQRKHLFFIRQSELGNEEYCNAAGYYNKQTGDFVVLPYSYIVKIACGDVPYRRFRTSNTKLNGKHRYLTSRIVFNNPEDAASFVLGQKTGLNEWVDRRGKGLLEYYKELNKPATSYANNVVSNVSFGHRFFINVKGVCKASGYYDPTNDCFYIAEDSFLSIHTDPEFDKTALGVARYRMLSSRCIKTNQYYKVKKDTKCRTASAAASYVLGKNSSYVEWEDIDGKGLCCFFPDRFFLYKDNVEKKEVSIDNTEDELVFSNENDGRHLFFIKWAGSAANLRYSAGGYYDTVTKKFVVLSGSIWSSEVSDNFRLSSSYLVRCRVMIKNCEQKKSRWCQVKDVPFMSPSQALLFITGECADGWDLWKDADGIPLKKIYKDDYKLINKK